MSGKTDLIRYAIVGLCVASGITDLIWGRIFNWITIPAFLAGLVVSSVYGGFSGFGEAMLAGAAGLVLYGWMFWIGMMGGGDVKLLMAIGAWGGLRFTVETAFLGVLLGGAMALLLLIFKGKLPDLARKMTGFFRSVLIKELVLEKLEIDRKLTMPFGIPIAAAAIWIALGDPWGALGFRLGI